MNKSTESPAGPIDVDRLARTIYEASDSYDEDGVEWEHQYGAAKREARAQAEAVIASRAVPEADAEAPAEDDGPRARQVAALHEAAAHLWAWGWYDLADHCRAHAEKEGSA